MDRVLAGTTQVVPRVRTAGIILGAVCLIALSGYISVPLWFTPVPMALQPHVCLFLGLVLSPRLAMSAMVTWLMLGVCGAPVFSQGLGGIALLLGPRGGYLLGYVIAVALMGRYMQSYPRRAGTALLLGNTVIYICGSIQLAQFVGWGAVLPLGVLPFLLGCGIKTCFCYAVWRKLFSTSSRELL